MSLVALPDVYEYPVASIIRLKNELGTVLAAEFTDVPLVGDDLTRAVVIIQSVLRWKCLKHTLVESSLSHVIGRKLSAAAWIDLAHALVGNRLQLSRLQAYSPWAVQLVDEFVPVQILKVEEGRKPDGTRGARLTVKVLAGPPAAMRLSWFWTGPQLDARAVKLGFDRVGRPEDPPKPHVLHHCRELVGLRCHALVSAMASRDVPGLTMMDPGKFVDRNRSLIKLRYRPVSQYPCPLDLPVFRECHYCPADQAKCPLACLDVPGRIGPCEGCGDMEALMPADPAVTRCEACLRVPPA